MFSHTIITQICVYTSIAPVMCYSLSHCCQRCVNLYTLHISPAKMTENLLAIVVCSIIMVIESEVNGEIFR